MYSFEWQNRIHFLTGQTLRQVIPVGGGSIAESYRLETETRKSYFLKTGCRSRMFRCEALGLQELRKANAHQPEGVHQPRHGAGGVQDAEGSEPSGYDISRLWSDEPFAGEDPSRAVDLRSRAAIRVPEVFEVGEDYLLLEYIPSGRPSGNFFGRFGRALAKLHRYTALEYGFKEDNYIGATPQPNRPEGPEATSWPAFYLHKRLRFQFDLAEKNGYGTPALKNGFAVLASRLEELLAGSEEPPTLLHGDLWGGNYLCDENNAPVLIDPAVYYGHREADLAMTRMFGGFTREFYDAYQADYPLKPGWEDREPLYLLYHVLNHLNLFGRGYLAQAESILRQYT